MIDFEWIYCPGCLCPFNVNEWKLIQAPLLRSYFSPPTEQQILQSVIIQKLITFLSVKSDKQIYNLAPKLESGML